MSEPFIGQLMAVGFNFAPRGWAFCDGQLLPISSNTALFSLLGTTFGGDGRTTFGLPDLRGRTAVGVGTGSGLGPVTWGQKRGAENTTLNTNNLPAHSHALHGRAEDGTSPKPENNLLAGGTNIYGTGNQDTTMSAQSIGNTGNGQPFANVPPQLGLHWCIALQGVFPSRS